MDLYQSERTKFDVPLSHLDHKYIESCTDIKELERILKILRSGTEGTYPDLEILTEGQLTAQNPNSKLLRKTVPVSTKHDVDKAEWQEISEDLQNWESEMKELGGSKGATTANLHGNLPPVRGKQIIINDSKDEESDKNKPKKPMPREYREWDKVDVDAELAKVDGEMPKSKPKPSVRSVPEDVPSDINSKDLSEQEKEIKAEQEKNKGNEAFRAGDYEEALIYYKRSLNLKPTAAAYNNRAQTYLKLSRWKDACSDCNTVLRLDKGNLKGYLRRAVGRQGMKDYTNAKKDVQYVLTQEPSNRRAQEILKEIEKALMEQKVKGRRMVIEEVEGSDDEDEQSSNAIPNGHQPMCSEEPAKNTDRDTLGGEAQLNGSEERAVNEQDNVDKWENNKNDRLSGVDNDVQANEDSVGTVENQFAVDETGASCVGNEIESSPGSKVTVSQSEPQHPDPNAKQLPETGNMQNSQELPTDFSGGATTGIPNSTVKPEVVSSEENHTPAEKVDPVQPTPPAEKLDPVQPTPAEKPEPPVVKPAPPLPPAVIKMKDKANEMFRAGQYVEARTSYSKAIERLMAGGAEYTVHLPVLYSNRAACNHKLGDCQAAIMDSTEALRLNPLNVKPYLRRATAYETLERLREAYVDYRQVLLLDSSAQAAQHGSTRCSQALRERDGIYWREKLPNVNPVAQSLDDLHEQYHMDSTTQASRLSQAPPTSQVPPSSQVPSSSQAASPSSEIPPPMTGLPSESSESKDPKQLCDEHKTKGNSLVKEGKYSEAIHHYSQCIELCPKQIAAYTNRALCYLKTKQPKLVVKDCTLALMLEVNNVKALFRRALAYKDLELYEDSCTDMKSLLKVDPKNSAARKEFMEILRLKQASEEKQRNEEKKTAPKSRKRVEIQQVDNSSEDEDLSEVPKAKSSSSHKAESPSTTCTKSQSNSKKNSKTVIGSEAKKQPKNQATKQSQKLGSDSASVKVPTTAPSLKRATPYEFMQAWMSLKGVTQIRMYTTLLCQVEPKSLKTVISNKLDADMLMTIVRCTKDLVEQGEEKKALDYLVNLPLVPRFQMVAMFMSSQDKQEVSSVVESLQSMLDNDSKVAKGVTIIRKQFKL